MQNNNDWDRVFEKFLKNARNWKCYRCGALLAKEKVLLGQVEIKCRKCNTINTIKFNDLSKVVNILQSALDKKQKK